MDETDNADDHGSFEIISGLTIRAIRLIRAIRVCNSCLEFVSYIRIMRIAIINGPNLNLLGKRETDIYGNESFDAYFLKLKDKFKAVELTSFQSNVEGELINEIQRVGFEYDGIVLNPGGYTHTSVAVGDAVAAIIAPVVEVHISNIFGREEFRKLSHVSGKAVGVISGLGLQGYDLAIRFLTGQI